MSWKDILKTHCNEKADNEKQIFEKDLEDLSGDGKVTRKDVLIGRGVLDKDGKKVKKAKAKITPIGKKILDEVKAEGGALDMKKLEKKFGKVKPTVQYLIRHGYLFQHKDGDLYTHKPSKGRGFTA